MNRFEKLVSLGFVCLAVALMTACIPEFENALPGPSPGGMDCDLLGSWAPEDGSAVMFFTPEASGWLKMVSFELSKETPELGQADLIMVDCFTSAVGESKYLCVRQEAGGGSPCVKSESEGRTFYLIVQYRITAAHTLEIRHLNEDYLVEMVEKGKLKGAIDSMGSVKTPKVTASSEELAEFFRAADPARLIDDTDTMILKYSKPLDTDNL